MISQTYTVAVDLAGTSQNISVASTNLSKKEILGTTFLTGPRGPIGPAGPTGGIVPITVSATAPPTPALNDLWIDISQRKIK